MSTTPERDQKAFVTDFFDTIEEAGLVDIAEAAGIYSAVARPGAGAAAAASSAGPSAAEAAAAAALNGIPGCVSPRVRRTRAKLVPPNCSRSHTAFR